MEILALIFIATGLVLLLVAKNVTNYLPPNYMGDTSGQQSDDGFVELLQTMGRLVRGVAYVFFVIGVVCLMIGLAT
jgi:hypothetical protein